VDLSRPPKGLRGREVEEAAMWRCIHLQQAHPSGLDVQLPPSWRSGGLLEGAYGRCAEVTSEYAKTFYLGTQLMTQQQARAIWAIYVWCRRTDELVDGPNASRITPKVRQEGGWVWVGGNARSAAAACSQACLARSSSSQPASQACQGLWHSSGNAAVVCTPVGRRAGNHTDSPSRCAACRADCLTRLLHHRRWTAGRSGWRLSLRGGPMMSSTPR
jgi:hypothetical protein